jgi:polyhydroxyalkanoate synthesis regulator phasin
MVEIGKFNKQELEDYIKQIETEIVNIEEKQFPEGVKQRELNDLISKIKWARLSLNTRFHTE